MEQPFDGTPGDDTLLETRVLRVHGLRVRYAVAGEGEPLILLHGFPETLQGWRLNLPVLARHFRVHAFDWPGLGVSDAPRRWHYNYRGYADFLKAVMDELEIDRAHLVAADISVPVALIFALENPSRVSRLVVSDGPAFYRPGLLSWEVRALQNEGPGEMMVYGFPRTMMRWAFGRGFHGSYTLPPEAFADYRRQAEDPDFRRVALQIFRSTRDDLEWLAFHVGQLEAPLLIIWGENDVFIDRMMGQELQAAVPRSRLEIIHRCGHFVHEEAAKEFNRLVYEFLTEETWRKSRALERAN